MTFVFSCEFCVMCWVKCYFCQFCIINLLHSPNARKLLSQTKTRVLKGSGLSQLENETQKTGFELQEQRATKRSRNRLPLRMGSNDISKARCIQCTPKPEAVTCFINWISFSLKVTCRDLLVYAVSSGGLGTGVLVFAISSQTFD